MQTPERRPRVLVADDDPDIQDLVAFKLTQAGFDVTCVGDGLLCAKKVWVPEA